MIVINSRTVKPEDRPGVSLKTIFSEQEKHGGKTTFGVVTIPPQARIPLSGAKGHPGNEYSIVTKGSILVGTVDTQYRMTAGDASLIPDGEEHWAYNDGEEDCEIVWALVGA